MAGKDPYQVLGVNKTDDTATIKSAFRKLAMKWHPDRNKEPGAKEMFADIGKAWAILENSEKRAAFEAGKIDFDGNDLTGAGAGGFNPNDLNPFMNNDRMRQAFTAFDDATDLDDPTLYGFKPAAKPAASAASSAANLNTQCTVRVDFVSAATGALLNVRLPNEKQVKVRIAAGVESGQKLKLKGHGKTSGDRVGDAYIDISVNDHAFFTRDGKNVCLTVPVTLDELLLQKSVEIPTVHGSCTVTPPLGEAFSKVQRLAGKGIDGGDQLVSYRLVLPEQVSDTVKAAVKELAGNASPRRHFGL